MLRCCTALAVVANLIQLKANYCYKPCKLIFRHQHAPTTLCEEQALVIKVMPRDAPKPLLCPPVHGRHGHFKFRQNEIECVYI